jgi:DNA-binding CsgD family transcriptional regulator
MPAAKKPTRQSKTMWFTPRERQVLDGICRARTNEQIGKTIALSTAAVKFHVGALLKKLRLKTREQILIWAFQHPEALHTGKTTETKLHKTGCECGSPYCAAMSPITLPSHGNIDTRTRLRES